MSTRYDGSEDWPGLDRGIVPPRLMGPDQSTNHSAQYPASDLTSDSADDSASEAAGEGELVRLERGREGTGTSYEWSESAPDAEHAATPSVPQVRILWPALGFPAVIAPRPGVSGDPVRTSDARRCITLLVVSDRKDLTPEQVAASLRCVPWAERGRRQVPAGGAGIFAASEISIPTAQMRPPKVLTVPKLKDGFGEMIVFGGDVDGVHGVAATLADRVRAFYRAQGLEFLHEIRISEQASARLAEGLHHLFWSNRAPATDAPSDELALLLERFAKPRRAELAAQWPQHRDFLLREYEYEYRPLHPFDGAPVKGRRTEILHPLFVSRGTRDALRVGHVTDVHVCVRADVYGRNLAPLGAKVAYNNWNVSFTRAYEGAKKDGDIVLLTGDLIDYGRGHWGQKETAKLGVDGMYQVDRNWFLFQDLLASGDAYRVPTYTILGNHDWRINPYPPFAIVGAPAPRLLFHDHASRTVEEQKKLLETAHGPGSGAKFSYRIAAEKRFGDILRQAGTVLKALGGLLTQTKTMDIEGSPAETTIASIEWYLLAINPFLDYAVSLPGGQQLLMLDWAEDEDVLFPVVYKGKEWPYMLWQLDDAADPGPKARRALTPMQRWLVEQLVEAPGAAKLIGIHAPPIAPYPDWKDKELLIGRKTYANPRSARGPTNYATRRPDGTVVEWNGHPIFAVAPKNGDAGVVADYGSFSQNREWFIRALANPKHGVRAVFSGHVHRNGLYVVHPPGEDAKKLLAGDLLVREVAPAAVRGAAPPAVSLTREGAQGPLYVVTTSGGPRGNDHFQETTEAERKHGGRSVDPGYAHLELAANGTIRRVEFRFIDTGVPRGRELDEEPAAAPAESWTFDEAMLESLLADVSRESTSFESFGATVAPPASGTDRDDLSRRIAEAIGSGEWGVGTD